MTSTTGTLNSIDALIVTSIELKSPLPPLDITIYTTIDGIPNQLLGRKEFAATAFKPYGSGGTYQSQVDLSDLHVELDAGTDYIVTFSTPYGIDEDPVNAPYWFGTTLSYNNPTPELVLRLNETLANHGTDWEVIPQRELALTVRAIPEPCTLGLAAIFTLALGSQRRHRVAYLGLFRRHPHPSIPSSRSVAVVGSGTPISCTA